MGQDTINLPPDFYGEALREAYAAWENTGWVRNTSGALEPNIKYVTDGATPRAYLKRGGAMSLVLASIDTSIATVDTLHRLDLSFDGELAQHPDPIVRVQREYHKNFHLPWCGLGGKTMVRGYKWLMYPNIYPKIDMYIYCGSRGQKIMFVVRPGGNANNLQMTFAGQNQMALDVFGNLKLLLQDKWVVLPEAVAYQYDQNNSISPLPWTAEYTPNNNNGTVGFTFDDYDDTKPLVLLIGPPPIGGQPLVTPGVCWSAYLGGDGQDQIFGSDVDLYSNFYVTGQTFSQETNFPVNNGTVYYEASPSIFISRFNADHELIWSNLFGCSTGQQAGNAIVVRDGTFPFHVFVGGRVSGTDLFPAHPSGSWFDDVNTGPAGFLADFNAETGDLIWSSYFGGSGASVRNICLGANGLVVTGHSQGELPEETITTMPSAEDWPHQASGADAYVAIVTPDYQIPWRTFLGGSNDDYGISVRTGPNKIVIVGTTNSDNIQILDGGPLALDEDELLGPGSDIFIMEFNAAGVQQWGTYSGLRFEVGAQGLAVNTVNGDVFIVGLTGSTTFPVTTAAPWYDDTYSTFTDGAILKISGVDRSVAYATLVSGNNSTLLSCVAVRSDGQYFVGGYTFDEELEVVPSPGLYSTNTLLGEGDGWIMSFTPYNDLSWATYFGGNETSVGSHTDVIYSLSVFGTTRLYTAGYTYADYEAGEFYPLTDAGGLSWDDQDLNPNTDGAVAVFCSGSLLVGVDEPQGALLENLVLTPLTTNSWTVMGLPIGQHHYDIVNALGQLVGTGTLRGGVPARIEMQSQSPGIFWVRFGGYPAKPILVLR